MSRESRKRREKNKIYQEIAENWDNIPWTPFREIPQEELSNDMLKTLGLTLPDVKRLMAGKIYLNTKYQVLVSPVKTGLDIDAVQLSIKTIDKSHRKDWRDYQRIKNELCGPEWEGVELYPAESRLVDTANQFYMFCFPPPFQFPFGFSERMVLEGDTPGTKQRPFPKDNRPSDLRTMSNEEIKERVLRGNQR